MLQIILVLLLEFIIKVGNPGITEFVQEIAQPEPYVLSYGDQLFLIIDCVVVTNVDVELLPLTLLSAYF